ncbi:twin-arginine translocase TatA/TatE family subunit [Amnibacterium kyonggiense]|uniref:Sec-independent protein translocase protein TatA n=1 Tax=Amnibacterium kyonggiense TaxID=595671 RepID=A0A4V3EAP1_9MICO|nr:twin-arginine translocase TatA/TatE family subunit [Amnibacterium kyonggiense]TDS77074.1 sec-independent protein translocase protein TatA [Amnibacterium kyonggiense]
MGLFAGLTGWHLLAIALVILVLFGATKLPVFAKGLGQSIKIFRKEVTEVQDDMAKDRAQRSDEHLDRETVTTPDPQTRRASEDR